MKMLMGLLLGASLLLTGCSSVIYKTVSVDTAPATSLSLDGKQRVILVTDRGGTLHDKRVVCAEPSPDALVGIAASASGGLSIAGKGSADAAASLAEAVQTVGRRTQTVQLLRDGLYRACEAYLNGAINEEEYKLIISRIDDFAVTLVAIDGLTGGLNVPATSIKPKTSAKKSQGAGTAADTEAAGDDGVVKAAEAAIQVSPENAKAVGEIIHAFYELQATMAEQDRITAEKMLDLKARSLDLEMKVKQLKSQK
jgi:hypothetical protein